MRMQSSTLALLSYTVVSLAGTALGDLKWEKPEQSFNATINDQSIVAHYKFTNTGSEPVKINDVKTSCGCTTAALPKTEYAAGESGEIEAKFQFGGRIGPQKKAIIVTTAHAPDKPTILQLFVNIEDPITIQPQFVVWHIGDRPNPKIIHIKVADNVTGKIVSATSDNPTIKTELRETKLAKEYNVEVTPTNVSQATSATILIKTDFPVENPQFRYGYVRVK